ncbi:MAG: hydroxymethylglutaryl-CoA lyase [Pseudomonadota bacterium]
MGELGAVEIIEVGPRDGLQNERAEISVAEKAAFIRACAAAGLRQIEVGSFVNPSRVPQMAATGEVLRAVGPLEGVRGMVLIPNARRLAQYLEVRGETAFDISRIAVFVSATEAFSEANLGCSVAESLGRVREIMAEKPADVRVRGYISCVTDCPFEGYVAPAAVGALSEELLALGCNSLALADTVGKGTPERVAAMFETALPPWNPAQVAAHFHDTQGLALANVDVALAAGIRRFDSSVAGLGGCPYAPGAPGNVATEAVVGHVEALGYETGIDVRELKALGDFARKLVGRVHDN